MITRRTKVQLVIFVLITLLGVTYVGAKYAQLDRMFIDRTFEVVAHYPESGGIFVGAEVTYRGVRIGKVSDMKLTTEGVDVVLSIEDEWAEIPADTRALVGNRSAVGEQYVELQPNVDSKPYLEDGSEIIETAVPIRTEKLLKDVSETVASVDQKALQTTVKELGVAFGGTGEDLQQIIDTGNSFIREANRNFGVTTALIRDSNTVLQGQVASESSLRMFATELSKFSTTLVGADADLRKVIDTGSFTANELKAFLEKIDVPLSDLLRKLVTTGEIVVRHLPGIEHFLVLFPWIVDGSWAVVSKSDGKYNAHFGMIVSSAKRCEQGYEPGGQRSPDESEYLKLSAAERCAEAAATSNARGPQHLRRAAPGQVDPAKVLGTYDADTGEFTWDQNASADPPGAVPSASTGTVAPAGLGKDAWKWLYLQPLLDNQG